MYRRKGIGEKEIMKEYRKVMFMAHNFNIREHISQQYQLEILLHYIF